jgi:hypothetical protein
MPKTPPPLPYAVYYIRIHLRPYLEIYISKKFEVTREVVLSCENIFKNKA